MIEVINQEPLTVSVIEFVNDTTEYIIAGGVIALAVAGVCSIVENIRERQKADVE